jgi:hypothetical protein
MTMLGSARSPASERDPSELLVDRNYRLPGVPASGAIVFSSLFVLLGLGAGGFLGLHAYVHRNDAAHHDDAPHLVIAAPSGAADVPSAEPGVDPVDPKVEVRTASTGTRESSFENRSR